jgi:hypothetical protein
MKITPMRYKISYRGLMRFDDLANKMAEIIYPQLVKAKNDFKTEIDQLTRNYNTLNSYYHTLSKDDQKKELKRFQDFAKMIGEEIQYDLESTFNQARFIIREKDLDNDFDVDIYVHPNNDWKGHYHNKKLTLSILDINSKEELAETLEHELIHNKQFKHMPNDFSSKSKKRMRQTNYYDLKVEGPALVTNVLRELPTLQEFLDHQYRQIKLQNPWVQFEEFVIEELSSLLSNSYKMQNFLNMSDMYRVIMQGDEDREPMQKQYRRNKFNKILHEAISKQAREILSTL